MVLKHLQKIVVQFAPSSGGARSAREFLSQVSAPKAQKSNPSCEVVTRIRARGEPFVEVTYQNQEVERIATRDHTVQSIMATINARTAEMETMASLQKAGFADVKLYSRFGAGGNAERAESGWSEKIAQT